MNILLLGSGGREHAIAWKLKQSPQLNQLYIAPGNAGTASLGTNVDLSPSDFKAVSEAVEKFDINMLIVGPEAPLVEGIIDYFRKNKKHQKLLLIGPSKIGAELEGSKEFAKNFMLDNNVPTAKYQAFQAETLAAGQTFLSQLQPPFVLKADGLAAGKGVLIIDDLREAQEALKEMLLDKKFGAASQTVVIEEFLAGVEMSVFVLTDGKSYKILPEAKDYKRIGEGDAGLNTGGMGAVSPVPFVNTTLMKKIEERIIKPSINGLDKKNIDYCGFLFIGLMIVKGEPFVIEYNVRLGDPETEVVVPRIKSDFLQHLKACAEGTLEEEELIIDESAATTVMLVSGGYPESYEKGKEIKGLDLIGDCIPFHAGTKVVDGKIVSNGGRVIAVTAMGSSFKDALAKSYRNAERIIFDKRYYRKDIGFDLMEI